MPPKKAAKKTKTPAKRKQSGRGKVPLRSHMKSYMLPNGVQNGEGFLSDIWDGVKKVGGFLKDSKILSTVGGMIPHPGVQQGAQILGQLGLGKRRKRKNVLRM